MSVQDQNPSFVSVGPVGGRRLGRLTRIAMDGLLAKLAPGLRFGKLTARLPDGMERVWVGDQDGPHASIDIHRWRAIWRTFRGGDIGFAEAYMDGDWSSPDLTSLILLADRNADKLSRAFFGAESSAAFSRLRHRLRANTKRGSKRNIAQHYDLGNAFYAQWLDPSMTYSSAYYGEGETSLEAAQQAKLDLIVDRLGTEDSDSVLEIGIGWGGLAERLLKSCACRLTGLTLSTEQLAYAKDRLATAGLSDRADLRLQDYRDVKGVFNRIVSIEMFEAVGAAYWSGYFDTLRRCLAAKGSAVLQVITIHDDRYSGYANSVDFIQRYIFPGGMLPSESILRREISAAGLALGEVKTFGTSYAETLAEWRRRFHAAWPSIEPLGFDKRFRRMWEYYLSYCEAGFRTGTLNVGLYTLSHKAAAEG